VNKYLVKIVSAAALLAIASMPAQAGGWYLGGGAVSLSFEDDLSVADSGGGITFSGGYQFDDMLSAEILSGGTYHDQDGFDDDVLQYNLMGGIKLSFGSDKFRPYGILGISFNVIEFGDLDDVEDAEDFEDFDEIDGFGYYAGFGADIFVAKQHAINISYRSNRWTGKGDGPDLDIQADMFIAAYNFYFEQ
jgi:opacity protein-like surface antigen